MLTLHQPHLHTLAIGSSPLIDVPPRRISTHKTDGGDVRVVQDAVDHVVGPMDDVEHPPEADRQRCKNA